MSVHWNSIPRIEDVVISLKPQQIIELKQGYIPEFIDKDFLRIKGWSCLMSGLGNEEINLTLSDQKIEIISLLPIKREDVVGKVKDVSPFCGFEITCNFKKIPYYDLEIVKKINLEIQVNNVVETLNLNRRITESKLSLTFPKLMREFYIEQALNSNLVLEYGSGSSTFFCVTNNVPIISVESDLIFLNYLKNEINFFTTNNSQVRLLHANIGNTKALGYPENDSSIKLYPQYATLPWKILSAQKLKPDLVLIDGRFRVACMLVTMANIKKPTKVIFDDYVGREYGHVIEKYIKPIKTIERAALFELNPGILSAENITNEISSFFDPS
jgi:hypothetical protein